MLMPDNAGGGTDVGGGLGQPSPTQADEKHQVKIDGEVQELTLEELKQKAALSGGAQSLMDKAAGIRKGAGQAVRLQELMTRMNSDASTPLTSSELEEVAIAQGLRGQQISQFVTLCQEAYDEADRVRSGRPPTGGSDGDTGGVNRGGEGAGDEGGRDDIDTSGGAKGKNFVTFDQLDPSLQREIKDLRARDNDRAVDSYRDQMMDDLKKKLDKDEVFGTLLGDRPELRKPIFEFVRKEITAAIATGEFDGDQLRNSVVQAVRERLQELGIGQPAKDSDKHLLDNALGPAESTNLALSALGGDGEPPKRVAATDPKAEGVFASRFAAKFRQHLKALSPRRGTS